jgi:DNA modification methylase
MSRKSNTPGKRTTRRNYEVFWGDRSEPERQRAGLVRAFADRHASTQAYIGFMRPRCVELARVLKKTGSFYYHCDWRTPPRSVSVRTSWRRYNRA